VALGISTTVRAATTAGTTITVEYYRPAARGRDRLFGKAVTASRGIRVQ
jgi:hypothetical protein